MCSSDLTLVLLSSTSVYLANPVMAELRLDHALCNRFEVEAGKLTGRASGEICFGPKKLGHARALAERLGADLAEATFYTDSASDLAVLEAVKDPVAVHPDPTLRRIARKRGWRIVDWDRG